MTRKLFLLLLLCVATVVALPYISTEADNHSGSGVSMERDGGLRTVLYALDEQTGLDWFRPRWGENEFRALREGAPDLFGTLDEQSGHVVRWPDGRRVTFWIDRPPGDPARAERLENEVRQGIERWSGAGLPIEFQETNRESKADLRFRWLPRLEGDEIGRTRIRYGPATGIQDGAVVIAFEDAHGAPLTPNRSTSVILHEIGHALGLGHTSTPTSVMHPKSRATHLSDSDLTHAHTLYQLPIGRTPDLALDSKEEVD